MNLGTPETFGNGNQDDEPTELTRPISEAEGLRFREVTKNWMIEDCNSRKLPVVKVHALLDDKKHFYATSPNPTYEGNTRDAFVNFNGLVKCQFDYPPGQSWRNYEPFPFDPRPEVKFGKCYHQFDADQQEHIYIARVDIGRIGNAPPEGQVEKFEALLQSMPMQSESTITLDFTPVGVKEAAVSFVNYWKLIDDTCFLRRISNGALLVAMSRIPDYQISISAYCRAGSMKGPYIWLHREWWNNQRMWGCIDESENRPKKIKNKNEPREGVIGLDNSTRSAGLPATESMNAAHPPIENKKINSPSAEEKLRSCKSLRKSPMVPALPGWLEKSDRPTVDSVIQNLKKISCHPTKFLIASHPAWAKNLSSAMGVSVSKFDIEAIAAEFGLVDQKSNCRVLRVPVGWWFGRSRQHAEQKSSLKYCI